MLIFKLSIPNILRLLLYTYHSRQAKDLIMSQAVGLGHLFLKIFRSFLALLKQALKRALIQLLIA